MTRRHQRALSKTHDKEVGYGKPPKRTQFKKGQSGNPKGRPKGAKNKPTPIDTTRLHQIITEEAYRDIRVNEGGAAVTMPVAKAVMRAIAVRAAKGEAGAQKMFTELLQGVEQADQEEKKFNLKHALEYKLNADEEVRRREARGISVADIIPHPDDIYIDMTTGEVNVVGPMTYGEQKKMEELLRKRETIIECLEEDEELLEIRGSKANQQSQRRYRNVMNEALERIDNFLGGWRPRYEIKAPDDN